METIYRHVLETLANDRHAGDHFPQGPEQDQDPANCGDDCGVDRQRAVVSSPPMSKGMPMRSLQKNAKTSKGRRQYFTRARSSPPWGSDRHSPDKASAIPLAVPVIPVGRHDYLVKHHSLDRE